MMPMMTNGELESGSDREAKWIQYLEGDEFGAAALQ